MLRFAKNQSAIFVGDEKENSSSPRTLFVVHEPDIDQVIQEAEAQNVKVIYFGAGFLSKPSMNYIDHALQRIDKDFHLHDIPEVILETNNVEYLRVAVKDWCIQVVATLVMEGAMVCDIAMVRALVDLKSRGYGHNIRVKFDLKEHTFSAPLKDVDLSSYDQYDDDTLLYKEETISPLVTATPLVVTTPYHSPLSY